jgi:hypothetical protein
VFQYLDKSVEAMIKTGLVRYMAPDEYPQVKQLIDQFEQDYESGSLAPGDIEPRQQAITAKVDESLATLGDIELQFEPPEAALSSTTKTIVNVFLYDLRENREYREGEWLRARSPGGESTYTLMKQRPPVRMDCAYLISVWVSKTAGASGEHKYLGAVVQSLLSYREVPIWALYGPFFNKTPPIHSLMVRNTNLKDLGEFWETIGNKPKAVLNYALIIPVQVYEPVSAGDTGAVAGFTIEPATPREIEQRKLDPHG